VRVELACEPIERDDRRRLELRHSLEDARPVSERESLRSSSAIWLSRPRLGSRDPLQALALRRSVGLEPYDLDERAIRIRFSRGVTAGKGFEPRPCGQQRGVTSRRRSSGRSAK
jgi:hypothetical protein